jgi:hypothetical protein
MGRLIKRDVNVQGRFALEMSPVRARITDAAPPIAEAAAQAGAAEQTEAESYAERLVKYIPAEVVAFYLAADKLFTKAPSAVASGTIADQFVAEHHYAFSIGVFLLGLVGTPFYFYQQAKATEPWRVQCLVSTLAFIVWAYAVQGGIFAPVYSAAIAGFAVLVFTFASGFVKPGT